MPPTQRSIGRVPQRRRRGNEVQDVGALIGGLRGVDRESLGNWTLGGSDAMPLRLRARGLDGGIFPGGA